MSSRENWTSTWRGNPVWAVRYTNHKRLWKSPEWLEVKGNWGMCYPHLPFSALPQTLLVATDGKQNTT